MATMLVVPTPVTNINRVDFVGSPKHLKIDISSNPSVNTVVVKLWVWDGIVTKPYTDNSQPSAVFKKSKVSAEDTYVIIEIGDVIASYIDPKITVDTDSSTVSDEGVYYQYEVYWYYNETDPTIATTQTFPTRFATLGYNWDYEGENGFNYNRGAFGFEDGGIKQYYSPFINYYNASLNLTGVSFSNEMVTRTPAVYTSDYVRCSPDQYLIVYLNKQGFWDTFTPGGEVNVGNKISRESFTRTYRDPLSVNQNLSHQNSQYNINSKQNYVINTGSLIENMGELVEEILYSRKVYLVHFLGMGTNGYTADTTVIHADTTLFTADYSFSLDVSDFIQIPVIVTDTDFNRKTRLNDRNKISYNIKFEGSNFKVNNIR